MVTAPPLAWVLVVSSAGLQLLRWVRVAQRENFRGSEVLRLYALWAFPPSSSATAVAHGANPSSRFLSAPFRAAENLFDRSSGHAGEIVPRHDARVTQRPISFTLIIGLLVLLTSFTHAAVIAFVSSAVYGLVFPWGFRLRGRQRPLSWGVRTVSLGGVVLVGSALLCLMSSVIPTYIAFVLAIWLVPLWVALGSKVVGRGHALPSLDEEAPIVISLSDRGTTVVTDDRPVTGQTAEESISVLTDLKMMGRHIVVTGGVVDRQGDRYVANYRLGSSILEANCELLAIGRTNAEALCSGFGAKFRRFDTRRDAERWMARNLTPDDGALYLGNFPDYYP